MTKVDLSRYGIAHTLNFSGEVREFPATTDDPKSAPIVFLVDEDHLAQAAVDASALDVIQILRGFPNTIITLEHFKAGEVVTSQSVSEFAPSNFHVQLANAGSNSLFGGDDTMAAHEIEELHDDLAVQLECFDMDHPHLDAGERAAKKEQFREDARIQVRTHPRQYKRSKDLVQTLLSKLSTSNRIGVINTGLSHNNHIIDNVDNQQQPLFMERTAVNFIRLRPTHELRQLAAFYKWRRRGSPLWEAEVDWAWAVQNVEGLAVPE